MMLRDGVAAALCMMLQAGLLVSTTAQVAGGQSFDFSKFMQYGSSYQNYMDYTSYMPAATPSRKTRTASANFAANSATQRGGGGGAAAAADYKQYMDYSKYMKGGSQNGASDSSNSSSGPGDYKQFMDYNKYMDYSKYMQGAGSAHGKASGSANFAANPAAQGGGGAAADYKQYMDYSKYMKGGSQNGASDSSNSSSGPGDYKQFMDYNKYMDYSKYMQGAGSAHGKASGSANFASDDASVSSLPASNPEPSFVANSDREKLMNNGDADSLSGELAGPDSADDRKEYLSYQAYMDYQKYAAWRDLIQTRGLKSVPASADACHSIEELKTWRDSMKTSAKNIVPTSFRKYAEVPIDEEYEERLAQLQNSSAVDTAWKFDAADPAREGDLLSELKKELNQSSSAPTSAKKCHSEADLKRWRNHQEKLLKATTPKFLQPMLLQNVAKEYQQNLARIHIEEANANEGQGTNSTQPGHPKAAAGEQPAASEKAWSEDAPQASSSSAASSDSSPSSASESQQESTPSTDSTPQQEKKEKEKQKEEKEKEKEKEKAEAEAEAEEREEQSSSSLRSPKTIEQSQEVDTNPTKLAAAFLPQNLQASSVLGLAALLGVVPVACAYWYGRTRVRVSQHSDESLEAPFLRLEAVV